MVFQGPPDEASEAFRDLGLPCADDSFIAEHMLEVGVLVLHMYAYSVQDTGCVQ
jgi:hypothetical protein